MNEIASPTAAAGTVLARQPKARSVPEPVPLPDRGAAGDRADIQLPVTIRREPGLAMRRVRTVLTAWLVPLLLLVAWVAASRWDWVPAVLLPAPQDVATTLYQEIASGDIAANLGISLQRVFFGFGVGALLGLALGVAMGLSPLFKDYTYPVLHVFAQVPTLGWLPLLMLLVGIGEELKLVLVAKAVLVPVALNALSGLEGVSKSYAEVAQVFRFNRWQLLSKVIFPAALPPLWNGLRFGLTKAWLTLVAVELLASSEGIGFMTAYARQLMQLDVVLSAVLVVGLVGWGLDRLLAAIETWLLRWRRGGY
jgi:sulfonate transport system permease protein